MVDSSTTTPSRDSEPTASRAKWSRWGFVLAASGSAIGLGNVVFFPANAYRFGGGGFYLPYLLALVLVGLPLMTLELGLGHQQRLAYPAALGRVAGRRGEWLGWWALVNTSLLTLYYVAILGWVLGMLFGALGPLWVPETLLEGFAVDRMANPAGYFFAMLSSCWPLLFIAVVWGLNGLIVWRGPSSIERAVKVFVPLMWVLMILLAIRGVTLPGGSDGVWDLFVPDPRALANPAVWQGAVSQIFFTLSIGFGVMTTYGSYLPRKSDQANNAVLISLLNCSFEVVAGIAIFSLLFVFAAVPQASTLAMTFFIVPQGIGQLPGGGGVVATFGVLFFGLLLLAGLSSTVSLVEGVVGALRDKLGLDRQRVVVVLCSLGVVGSSFFVLPQVVDPRVVDDGTLGLTLLDLLDHWVFGYGLLVVGLSQCLLLGQSGRVTAIRRQINQQSSWRLGRWFDHLIGRLIPLALVALLASGVIGEVRAGLYGAAYAENFAPGWRWLALAPVGVLVTWLALPAALAWWLSGLAAKTRKEAVTEDREAPIELGGGA